MALTVSKNSILSARNLTWIFAIVAILSGLAAYSENNRLRQINAFNQAVTEGKSPVTDKQSYEAKFATALWLAKTARFRDATLLFLQLAELGDANRRSAVQFNLGNMFFLRALAISGTNLTVKPEADYLMGQAKNAYQQSLRLDSNHWDARHNLDRVMGMMPENPTPGVGGDDKPGIIMGGIPVGLP
jgi:tetratricopeptide (TPR) repeat protein